MPDLWPKRNNVVVLDLALNEILKVVFEWFAIEDEIERFHIQAYQLGYLVFKLGYGASWVGRDVLEVALEVNNGEGVVFDVHVFLFF